jgi:uncharacterized protein (DUF2236 family)
VGETLFRPESVTWRVNQEPALLLGGGRALLMQLAHPAVAAGVAEHSDFRQRPVHRLARTLELTLALTFGTREQAAAAARQINAVHQRVRGVGYSASDQRLLLWVHATLIDSALVTHDAFVGRLSPSEQATYYREAKLLGGLLGLASSYYPEDLAAFVAYLDGMLAGDELVVDDRARELAGSVLKPPLRFVPELAFRPLEAITAGLLPPRLRREYRVRWGPLGRTAFAAARRGLPALLAALPPGWRRVPPARRAPGQSSNLGSLTNRSGQGVAPTVEEREDHGS